MGARASTVSRLEQPAQDACDPESSPDDGEGAIQFWGIVSHPEAADRQGALYGGEPWSETQDSRDWPHDPPLSDAGLMQARRFAETLCERFGNRVKDPMLYVVSSPYRRCLETAAEICHVFGEHHRLIIHKELCEIFGPEALPSRIDLKELLRPVDDFLNLCQFLTVRCDAHWGKWPAWPESATVARQRFAGCFLQHFTHAQKTEQNFILVSHADFAATGFALLQRGERVDSITRGAHIMATRKLSGKAYSPSLEPPEHSRASESSCSSLGSSAPQPGQQMRTLSPPGSSNSQKGPRNSRSTSCLPVQRVSSKGSRGSRGSARQRVSSSSLSSEDLSTVVPYKRHVSGGSGQSDRSSIQSDLRPSDLAGAVDLDAAFSAIGSWHISTAGLTLSTLKGTSLKLGVRKLIQKAKSLQRRDKLQRALEGLPAKIIWAADDEPSTHCPTMGVAESRTVAKDFEDRQYLYRCLKHVPGPAARPRHGLSKISRKIRQSDLNSRPPNQRGSADAHDPFASCSNESLDASNRDDEAEPEVMMSSEQRPSISLRSPSGNEQTLLSPVAEQHSSDQRQAMPQMLD
eukprot:gb/GFBE01034058.1/.p1 GENE.gb/GFBE01034058.1/~~gb/GFBE01034058.1/.p1  ORF type:complete len:575 (+),score=47.57 gb/GFBE01034058.1/:1-1725(+)